MRKFLLLLMMATTAATPALAQDRDGGERRGGFIGERLRSAVEERRSDSADRPVRAERQQQRQQQRLERRQDRVQDVGQRDEGSGLQRVLRADRLRQVEQRNRAITETREQRGLNDRIQEAIAIERARQGGDLRDGRRDRDGNWRDGDRDRNWRDGHRRYDNNWRNEWRRDRRYDWRRHRNSNRSAFRFGIYYDPFGYSYRPYSIGWPIRSSYWGSNYWLRDPWMYRLPPVYGPYRWIRYWDDAILVDMRSGRVVDVIHNFFW